MYEFKRVLAALSLAQRQNRWLASSKEDHGVRAGKFTLQDVGRKRNLRFFYRFVGRTQSVDQSQTKRHATKNQATADAKYTSQNRF